MNWGINERKHTLKISGSIAAKVQTILRSSGGSLGKKVIVGNISTSLSRDNRNKERSSIAAVGDGL